MSLGRSVAHAAACAALLVAGSIFLAATAAAAERPPAAVLAPQDTLVFVSIADVPTLKARFAETSFGRMAQDPAIRPLILSLYDIGVGAFAQNVASRVGLSLNELLAIPGGEIALAIVPVEGRLPAFIFFLDAGKNAALLDKLIAGVEDTFEANGRLRQEETLDDMKIVTYDARGGLSMVRKDASLVVSSDISVLKDVMARWTIEPIDNLADNRNFGAVMSRCPNPMDDPPQIFAYADPMALLRQMSGTSGELSVFMAFGPLLGLDGILAAGATYHMAIDEYDSVMQLDLLLDAPREGAVELFALTSGDNTPEAWVPPNAADYTTLHWDVHFTYEKLAALVDGIQGEGAFARLVTSQLLNNVGVDLEEEILPLIVGRASFASVIEPPYRPGSDAKVFGVQVTDPDAADALLARVAAQHVDFVEAKRYGDIEYFITRQREGIDPDSPRGRTRLCAAVVGDYLLMADRESALLEAFAARAETEGALAAATDYLLVADKVDQLYQAPPSMFSFGRPEESLRIPYEMAISPDNRAQLREQAANNELLKKVVDALDAHPLPPFDVLRQYLAPGGAALTNDASGLHYMTFSLRPPSE